MWKLHIIDDQNQRTAVNLVRKEYSVGRSEGNAIRLSERNISRSHAVIRRSGNGFLVEDLGSYNGVFVNGVRVVGRQDLGHHDLVQLGDFRVEVLDEALDTQEQNFQPYSGAIKPASGRLPDRLVVLIGPNQGSEYALENERYLIGRDEDCDFPIEHASVSRIHAEVRRLDSEHFEILDKGSANGLRVNGHSRPRAVLDGRDVIEIGDVVLKFISKGQVFHVSAAEGRRIAALGGSNPPPTSNKTRIPMRNLLLAVFAASVALGGLLLLLSGEEAHHQESGPSPAAILEQAVSAHETGDVFAAHELLTGISESSQVCDSPEFIAVESAWAQAMLQAAAHEDDLNQRRHLLTEVSRTETVPTHQRKSAQKALTLLSTQQKSVALDDIDAGNN